MPRRFPYGYEMQQGCILICESEAEVIRWIFRKRLEGVSGYQMAKTLKDSKVDYFSDNIRKASCKVSKILYDSRYIGEKEYPAIVQQDVFAQVQNLKGKPFFQKAELKRSENADPVATAYLPSDEVLQKERILTERLDSGQTVLKDAIFALAADKYDCIIERSTP